MTRNQSIARVACFAALGAATAAADDRCGTVVTDEVIAAELELQASGFYDRPVPRSSGDFNYIRVAIHIVRRSDGSGGETVSRIQEALDRANDEFSPARVVLTPIYLDTIDSDAFYELGSDAERDLLRQQNVIAGALNVYFVGDAPTCGHSSFPLTEAQGIVMEHLCSGPNSWFSHEVGHYFNLYHTHETGFGEDCPGNPNCDWDGDQCCDTPPDPNLASCSDPHESESCIAGNCAYIGAFICINGLPYQPDTHNTMSYSNADTCMTGFSADQRARIAAALTLPNRADEIMLEHPCGRATYTSLFSSTWAGTWEHPMLTIRQGIAIARPCSPQDGGVLVVTRGTYREGSALYNTPVTITASRSGLGPVVEMRP